MSIPTRPMLTNRTCLQEISINTLQRHKATDKLRKKFDLKLSISRQTPLGPKNKQISVLTSLTQTKHTPVTTFSGICKLPTELLQIILTYLKPEEILSKVQLVSKSCFAIVQSPYFWRTMEEIAPISFEHKYVKQRKVVERRSKGKLYVAKNRVTGKPMMVRKVLLDVTNSEKDDGVPTSILREISYLASMDNPKIGTVAEAQVKGGMLFLSYPYHQFNLREYMKGFVECEETLDPRTPKGGRYSMPLSKIKKIMYELVESLDYCHKHGVLHRNLKPENILLTSEEHVVISDFSLSRIVTIPHTPYTPEDPKERERSGREARRLWYRAPELLFRKNIYTFEVDIWTLGCVLAELAINEPLFDCDTEIEQLFKIFSFLGVPVDWTCVGNIGEPKVEFPKWAPINISHAAAEKRSWEFRRLCEILVPNREATFQKLMKLSAVLGEQGMDLLEMLLQINPQARPTTEAILSHPFFSSLVPPRFYQPSNLNYPQALIPTPTLENMWNSLHKNESTHRPKCGYMSKQTSVNETMRSILIDWLIDVNVHFDLSQETLHLAIVYLDRVLSEKVIDKSKLQLLGVTCMKIADVFNERSKEYYRQENAKEYAFITAGEYTEKDLLDMEKDILMIMKFHLYSPTCAHFLKIYYNVINIDEATKVLSSYLADVMLLNYESINFPPSLLASAILCFACYVQKSTPPKEVLEQAEGVYGIYTWSEFEKAVVYVKQTWLLAKSTQTFSRFDAVNNKYEKQSLVNIRTLWPPSVTHTVIENWIYPKKLKEEVKPEPMELD